MRWKLSEVVATGQGELEAGEVLDKHGKLREAYSKHGQNESCTSIFAVVATINILVKNKDAESENHCVCVCVCS